MDDEDVFDPSWDPNAERTADADPGFLNIPGRANIYRHGMLMPRICRVCGLRMLKFAPLAIRCRVCDAPDPGSYSPWTF